MNLPTSMLNSHREGKDPLWENHTPMRSKRREGGETEVQVGKCRTSVLRSEKPESTRKRVL